MKSICLTLHEPTLALAAGAMFWITLAPGIALAQQADRSLNLIDVHQGGGLSEYVRAVSMGGYDLSSTPGSGVEFKSLGPWYQTYWPDFSVEWLLQLDRDNGLLFGASTGERGEKYQLEPSVKLGFITQSHPRPNATLSLTLTTNLWGHLSENTCVGEYGLGGELGTYTVNCRLAAGELEPKETLRYLFNEDPSRLNVSLSYFVDF